MSANPDALPSRRRRIDDALVPLTAMYGEHSGTTVDFIHIEALRERSELFDWSIDAHTHAGLHQVVLLLTGEVQVALDEARHDVVAPAVIAIPAGVVHSFEYEPESAGFMLTVADGQLDGTSIGAWVRARLFETGITLGLEPADGLVERLRALSAELVKEQATLDHARVATIDWLTRTVLVLLARESERVHRTRPESHASDLFREFRNMVEAYFTEHWPVGRFAQHLHVSESSLNRLCRTVAGSTAFEIIQDRIELEARRRLIYTTVPIQRLASDLGFADPSYFARFFRRRAGVPPRTFRAQHQPSGSTA